MPDPTDKIRSGIEYISMFYTYSESCRDTLHDMNTKDKKVFYNIDLSSVFAYIFNSPPSKDVPRFKESGKNFARQLISSKGTDIGFTPFFTVFGMLELVDQYVHHAEAIKSDLLLHVNHQKIIDKVFKMEFFDFERRISTNSYAERLIRRFNYVLKGDNFESYHRRALSLIGQNSPICGVGDILGKKFKIDSRYKDMYNDLFRRMKSTRRDDTRSPKDSNFHFMMDCGNMVLCRALRDLLGDAVYFVTDQSQRKYISSIYRNPVGVSLWCAAQRMETNGLAGNAMDFIQDIYDSSSKLYNRLKPLHNLAGSMSLADFLKEIPPYTASEIKFFVDHKVSASNIQRPSDVRDLWNEFNYNARACYLSPSDFQQRAESQITSIEEKARMLVNLLPELMDQDLIMDLKIEEDDVVKDIFNKYR